MTARTAKAMAPTNTGRPLEPCTSVSPLTRQKGLGAIDVETLQKGARAWKQIGLVERELDMKAVVSQDLLPGKK